MNCETCREHLVDYLYGELDEHRHQAVEAALSACPECRDELASLRAIRDGWQRTPEHEPPARMHANILREARLAADARSASGSDAPWWSLVFQPAVAMAAVAVIGVGVSIAVVSTDGGSDAGSMEAVANAPVVDESAESAAVAVLEEADDSSSGADDLERSPARDRMDEAEDEEADEVDTAVATGLPAAAVDAVEGAPGGPRTTTSRGYDGATLAESPGAGLGGGGAMPVREPWQSRTLGGSALDNEMGDRVVTNALRPEPEPEPEAAPAVAQAQLTDYDMDRNRDRAASGSSGLDDTIGANAGSTGASSATGRGAASSASGAAPSRPSRGAVDDMYGGAIARGDTSSSTARATPPPSPAPTPTPAQDPVAAEEAEAWGAEDDADGEVALYDDAFTDETAREARAELGVTPDDAWARGSAAYDRGDWFTAVDELSSFVAASSPGDARRAEALYHVGAAQVQLGQRAEARATLERFVSLYPEHPWVEQARRLMQDLEVDDTPMEMRRQNAAPAADPALDSTYE